MRYAEEKIIEPLFDVTKGGTKDLVHKLLSSIVDHYGSQELSDEQVSEVMFVCGYLNEALGKAGEKKEEKYYDA